MKRLLRKGLNVAELIGIFAMVGVLCGVITPHLLKVKRAGQVSKLRFNLQKLRKRIEAYQSREGKPPEDVTLALETDGVPDNPLSKSDDRNYVKRIQSDPPSGRDLSPSGSGGWLYNPRTGGIWADHPTFVAE